MTNKCLHIGVTGGIGAGKSTVSKVFTVLRIPVYDADSRAKWLMQNDPVLKNFVIELFGQEAYNDGVLNRTLLAKTAFSDPEKLKKLNQLVHPKVGTDYQEWILTHTDEPYTLKEAALLFETGSYQCLDKIILVTAIEELRIQRVLSRDAHRTESDVRKIIAQQWPEEKKIELSDFVIVNDESDLVIPQVLDVHKKLLAKING